MTGNDAEPDPVRGPESRSVDPTQPIEQSGGRAEGVGGRGDAPVSRAEGTSERAEADSGQPTPVEETEDDPVLQTSRNEPATPMTLGGRFLAGVREFVLVGAIALVLSFLVKTFLIQAFFIPSESMEDTLIVHDRVIVSKLTPGLVDLKRGDIVVFADPDHWLAPTPEADRGPILNGLRDGLTFVGLLPDTAEGHLIKRVIGLPGDKVACCSKDGHLTVNGKAINEPYIKPGENPSDIDFDITVPKGRIWVMGDNRGHSSDSRLHDPSGNGSDGSVPIDLVVGRAIVTVWPLNRITWLSNYGPTFASVPAAPPAAGK